MFAGPEMMLNRSFLVRPWPAARAVAQIITKNEICELEAIKNWMLEIYQRNLLHFLPTDPQKKQNNPKT